MTTQRNPFNSILGKRHLNVKRGKRHTAGSHCAFQFEALEDRRVLAATVLGGIAGLVSLDSDENGQFDVGEEIEGAIVQIFTDTDGDMLFDPSLDSLVAEATSNVDGIYEVNELVSGDYFVVQPSQVAAGFSLGQRVSALTSVSGAGQFVSSIDDFSTESAEIEAGPMAGDSASSVTDNATPLGFQRDLTATLADVTGGVGQERVAIGAGSGLLVTDPTNFAIGSYIVEWDGVDGAGDGINTTGLGNFDLLNSSLSPSPPAEGICIHDVNPDKAGVSIVVRIYTDADNFSEVTFDNLIADQNQDLYVSFAANSNNDLVLEPAGAVGGADLTNVGAITLEIIDAVDGTDFTMGAIDVVTTAFVPVDLFNDSEAPRIDVEAFTNGSQADLPTDADVPNLTAGSTVTWTYQVTNTGAIDITEVTLTDDQLGSVTTIVDQGDGDDVLSPGEVWTFEETGSAINGAYMNTATVVVDTASAGMATDSDTSNYLGGLSVIDIEAFTNGAQADDINDADVPVLVEGATVTWTYEVRNIGSFDLTGVSVSDDQIGFVTDLIDNGDGDDTLQSGESWTYLATGIVTLGDYENVATVSATGSDLVMPTDSDVSHYVGEPLINPAIAIQVLNNGVGDDVVPVINEGELVEFTYLVSNTGDVVLGNIQVSDDNGTPTDVADDFFATYRSGDSNANDQLDFGETWTFQSFRVASLGMFTATGTATGDFDVNTTVMASDSASHIGDEATGSFGWHNERLVSDVNDDGVVAGSDAVAIVNELIQHQFSDPSTGELDPPPATLFYDADDDGFVAGRDVLIVLNDIEIAAALDLNGEEDGTGLDVEIPFLESSVFLFDSRLTLDHAGNSMLQSVTFNAGMLMSAQESFAADVTGTSISASTTVDGTFTLSGSDTVTNYLRVLRSVQYISPTPGGVRPATPIDVSLNDGSNFSNVATVTVIQQIVAPAVDLNGSESGRDLSVELPLESTSLALFDSALTVIPGSALSLASASLSIQDFVAGEESLSVDTTGTSIVANFDESTGVLTLTGSDTLANYQTVLRSATLQVTTAGASRTPILIQVAISDGNLVSDPATVTVNREVIPAILDLNGAEDGNDVALDFGALDSSVSLFDSRLMIGEGSSATLNSASLAIQGFVAAEESLAVDTSGTSVLAFFELSTGILSLLGEDTIANYEMVLRTATLMFNSPGGTRDTVVVDVVVSDGSAESNTAVVTASRLALPAMIDLNGAEEGTDLELSYLDTEDSLMLFDDRLTLVAGSNPNLTSAVVGIENFMAGDEETLEVDTTGTLITSSFNGISGILTLSGSDTVENYESVLRTVNLLLVAPDNPIQLNVILNDGTSDSNTVTVTATAVSVQLDLNGDDLGTDVSVFLPSEATSLPLLDSRFSIQGSATMINTAVVTIQGFVDGEELLSVDTTGTSIVPFFDATTGQLQIFEPASVADIEMVLRTLTLDLTTAGGTRSPIELVMVVNDGTIDSNAATITVSSNTAPLLQPIEDVTLLAGSPLHIPLLASDGEGDALSFTATSDNAMVSTFVPEGNRSARVTVSSPSDPNFVGGDMVFELFEGRAPRPTARIIELANDGFYDDIIFHRVIDSFVIQSGDPTATGSGGSALGDFDDQYHPDLQHNRTGVLSMAKILDDTNDSQFFVTEGAARNLDFQHSVFGQLISGEEVREEISNVATSGTDRPLNDVVIDAFEIFVDDQNGVLMLSAPEGFIGNAMITVMVSDGNGGTFEQAFNVTVEPDTHDNQPYLADIPMLAMSTDSTATFQLSAMDLEGDEFTFLDDDSLLSGPFGSELLQPNTQTDLLYTVNPISGELTVVARNGLTGTFELTVGVVANDALFLSFGRPIDLQVITIVIS